MRGPKTKDEREHAAFRLRLFNQRLYFFESLDAELYISADGTQKICIENSHNLTLEAWGDHARLNNRYCVDGGQQWFVTDLTRKVNLIKAELATLWGTPEGHEIANLGGKL